jgi:hypothetical protein
MWFVVVGDELGVMQQEVPAARFKILSCDMSGKTEESHIDASVKTRYRYTYPLFCHDQKLKFGQLCSKKFHSVQTWY